jgi:methionyl aminopeptidase
MPNASDPKEAVDAKERIPAPEAEEEVDEVEEEGVPGNPSVGEHANDCLLCSSLLKCNEGDAKKKKKKKRPKKKKPEQSEPPRVGLSKLFPDGVYPEGEIQEYKNECVWFNSDL